MMITTDGYGLSIKQADRLYTATLNQNKVLNLKQIGCGRDFALQGTIVRNKSIIFQVIKLLNNLSNGNQNTKQN